MTRTLRESASELVSLLPEAPSGAADLLERTGPPTHLAYLLISNIAVPILEKVAVLEANRGEDSASQGSRNSSPSAGGPSGFAEDKQEGEGRSVENAA